MSKESKKYANPVRKAKYEDDGPTLKLHKFVKPETKDKQGNKFGLLKDDDMSWLPVIKGDPVPGRKPKKAKLFTKPGRKPAPPAPPLPKAKEVKPHSRPPKGMKNPVTVKSGTLKRGKKKK